MKKFITYFDFLGYKSFILNNTSEDINQRTKQLLVYIQTSLSQNKVTKKSADLSNFGIKCLFVSDTIILWTNDDKKESFEELLKISFNINRGNLLQFPLRGVMFYDEINIIRGNYQNQKGGSFFADTIYGKGLVNAHLKVKNMNLAGSVIDISVINKIKEFINPDEYLRKYAVRYNVPYKSSSEGNKKEYCFRFEEDKINEENFESNKKLIEERFKGDNKEYTSDAKIKFENTIKFLEWLKG